MTGCANYEVQFLQRLHSINIGKSILHCKLFFSSNKEALFHNKEKIEKQECFFVWALKTTHWLFQLTTPLPSRNAQTKFFLCKTSLVCQISIVWSCFLEHGAILGVASYEKCPPHKVTLTLEASLSFPFLLSTPTLNTNIDMVFAKIWHSACVSSRNTHGSRVKGKSSLLLDRPRHPGVLALEGGKVRKDFPQNIFPSVDTSPPIAFLFHYGENISPKAVIAASVPIDHKGCEITSQNHLIARDRRRATIHKIIGKYLMNRRR